MKTGPLSLEMFNHAATDLGEKGEINLGSIVNICTKTLWTKLQKKYNVS